METFWTCCCLIVCVYMMNCACLQDSVSGTSIPSLWGKKVDFIGHKCTFWQLSAGCSVPALEELSVCVSLWKKIASPQWTVFEYKLRGEERAELALMGKKGSLQAWLFGNEWSTPITLPLHTWHTICLTWSGPSRHLRVYVNNTRVLVARVYLQEHGRPRRLAPGGILTLGASHGFAGGGMVAESGTGFQGAMTLFRMWGRERSPQQLSALSCTEGEVVRWSNRDWNTAGCQPIPETGLKCAWSLYEIQVKVVIICWDGNATNIHEAKENVNNWLGSKLPPNMFVYSVSVSFSKRGSPDVRDREEAQERRPSPVLTHFDCTAHVRVIPSTDVGEVQMKIFHLLITHNASGDLQVIPDTSITVQPVEAFPFVTEHPPVTATTDSAVMASESQTTSHGPLRPGPTHTAQIPTTEPILIPRDIFYRVNLNVTMSGSTEHDPGKIIQIWLHTALPGDQMFVLNFKLLARTHSQMECRTPEMGKLTLASLPSSGCTFQVKVNSSLDDIGRTEALIRKLLMANSALGSITLHAKPKDIQISHIKPGSCPEQNQQTRHGVYVWPQTKAECTVTVPCEGALGYTASRNCELDAVTERAKWTAPDLRSCPFIVISISDLDHIDITQNNSMDVLNMILNLTREHTILNDPEVVIVLNKLSEVLKVSEVTPSLGKTMVDIIADILESSINLSPVTSRILNITEDIGDKMSFNGVSYNMVAPSLAISLVNVKPGQFHGMTFGVSSALQGLRPEIFINEDPLKDTVAFISLPQEVENRFPQHIETPARIQFHFYGVPELFKDVNSDKELNTYVVSASVTNATIRDLEQQLKDKIECVYWDFNKNDGLGGWSSNGCAKYNTSVSQTTCVCDHLTHFGVLLDVSRTPVSEKDEEILTIISYLGCGISSIFLGVSLLTYMAFEKLRRDYPSKILINLSLALLGLDLVFLVDSWLASFNSDGLCIFVAASLHYFLLAAFTWMGLEAVHMYFALVKVFNVYVPSYILKFCVFGWGVPLVIVSLILAVKRDAYGSTFNGRALEPLDSSELFCWLQDDVVYYVSVVAYILLVLLCNMSVFVVVLVQIRNMRANKPAGSHRGLLHDLRGVASLTFLLGLTWIPNFFAWDSAKVPLVYLFSILNSLQGFFIFVFHCLMKENVRKQWKANLCCGRFRLKDHSEWSQTVTVGVKSRLNLVHTPSLKSARSDNSNSTFTSSSVSAQRLVSTRRPELELVYDNPFAFPRARSSSSSLPSECNTFTSETDCGMLPWPPKNRFN